MTVCADCVQGGQEHEEDTEEGKSRRARPSGLLEAQGMFSI